MSHIRGRSGRSHLRPLCQSHPQAITADAEFLARTLPSLPDERRTLTGGDPGPERRNHRAGQGRSPGTAYRSGAEGLTAGGRAAGHQTDRRYLAKALACGFRTCHLFGPASPILAEMTSGITCGSCSMRVGFETDKQCHPDRIVQPHGWPTNTSAPEIRKSDTPAAVAAPEQPSANQDGKRSPASSCGRDRKPRSSRP